VFGPTSGVHGIGIFAIGIVRGNTVSGFTNAPGSAPGISATGVVTGNYVSRNRFGMEIGQGSTVIGNTVLGNEFEGLFVACPSNVTDNTAVNNGGFGNLVLRGQGCNNTNTGSIVEGLRVF